MMMCIVIDAQLSFKEATNVGVFEADRIAE